MVGKDGIFPSVAKCTHCSYDLGEGILVVGHSSVEHVFQVFAWLIYVQ